MGVEPEMLRDDMIERLRALDEEASLTFDNIERMHLIIVGGGALVLMNVITRATHDIDAFYIPNKLQSMMAAYDINTKVSGYMYSFPFNLEDRIQPVDVGGKLIDFYTASLEDIVIAKLCSPRDTDIKDVEDAGVLAAIDWDMLHHLATSEDELYMSGMSENRYKEFLDVFTEYERRFRPCDS